MIEVKKILHKKKSQHMLAFLLYIKFFMGWSINVFLIIPEQYVNYKLILFHRKHASTEVIKHLYLRFVYFYK